ncbi:MAG: phosphoribosylformylglycinamidine synthase [Marinilabiliaceae bacterium]|nr:phosphoribosylformylglycinamidine synthase [Marinilabiliaceae bacterium]
MILFFKNSKIFAVETDKILSNSDIQKLEWIFGNATFIDTDHLDGIFLGPKKEMVTPWSTNAVEIAQNTGIQNIKRIEEFLFVENEKCDYDPMLKQLYNQLDQNIFKLDKSPEPTVFIDNIADYNNKEGLALSNDEIDYLNNLSKKLNRQLTDSEVFGFSQVNSEHCRHKIFNAQFIINGETKEDSLFQMIKRTSKENPNFIVSAYKDNVAFIKGPRAVQFSPQTHEKPDFFIEKDVDTVISLKAETHNFPTTVEPFNGAATGSGGEIRDRLAGGKGSIPLAGTAVYMTAFPRLEGGHEWENTIPQRDWLYQTPEQILIKASNGASDFGNKFGQPLINGSLFTFEHFENNKKYAYDKVIMLAGGIGYANSCDSLKDTPEVGDKIVVLGGDNYRIGMGGGAVSSVATGEFKNVIELNAVQRSNPEMQKRTMNVIRAMVESLENPIVSIHDHGAGGHLNSLSELVEKTGGIIYLEKLPIGDPTLSAKEIIGNESQERMGLIIKEKDIDKITDIAHRERSPIYVVGEITDDMKFKIDNNNDIAPIDLHLSDFFGNPPRTIMKDETITEKYSELKYDASKILDYIEQVLQLEGVACKDWLTNKVDRSVGGRVAKQQCAGEIQLPLNNLGVTTIDFHNKTGIASAIGHAPAAALINSAAGSILSVAESLTNIVWAPFTHGLKGISLSANWMWPCKNKGEDVRLYTAVKALSDFAIELGINVPTGKDSLSMTQKYSDQKVFSPGTVIVSACGEVSDVRKIVEPVLAKDVNTTLLYINLSQDEFKLGGSSFAQTLNLLGNETPTVKDTNFFINAFTALQELINKGLLLVGHDISAGGLVTTLLEMCFANISHGLNINLSDFSETNIVKILFAENPGVVVQVSDIKNVTQILEKYEIGFTKLGHPTEERTITFTGKNNDIVLDINTLRDVWFKKSYLLDIRQSGQNEADARYLNYKKQPLYFRFPNNFTGKIGQSTNINKSNSEKRKPQAAIIREKGCQCDRETAYALYLAGFDVKDVHTTDLISGRENLENINMIVFVGGFSNSDVLGSAKGWAGALKYNINAQRILENYYNRTDTLSLGICNGCQLMVELDFIYPQHSQKPKMLHNSSNKFESQFVSVDIEVNNSIMLHTLAGSRLGIWVAHGEGKFNLPLAESNYNIPIKWGYDSYPANPNGSDYNTAAICSFDGRHLAMMPHIERAIFPWQWAFYPKNRNDEISPWIEAFINARKWIEG